MDHWSGPYGPYIAIVILLALFAGFIWEKYPPEVTAIGGAAVFMLFGFVPASQLSAVFGNPAPITIAAMFVISGSLVRTGLLDALANAVIGRSQGRPLLAIGVFLVVTMIASAFVNTTPVVLVLIPIVVRLARSLDMASTKLLIPLSYAAILGGTCTLIGTSTNILVDGVARGMGVEGFSIFEIAPVGIIVALSGGLTMGLLGRHLLPDRRGIKEGTFAGETDFLSEITILGTYEHLGKSVLDAPEFQRSGLQVRGLRTGGNLIRDRLADRMLTAGDKLVVVASTSELLTLEETSGLRVGLRHTAESDSEEEPVVAEAIVTPRRTSNGESIANLAIGRRDGLRVLGAHRQGHVAGAELSTVRLRAADKLLMKGPAAGFDSLVKTGDLVSVTRPSGRAFRRRQAPIALLALSAVVILAALGTAGITLLALMAVAVILLLRCIDNDEAWSSIDISIIMLIFAMLTVGLGLQNAGAIDLIIDVITPALIGLSPIALLLSVYLLTSLLTEMVTNNAVAVVLTPVVIGLADQLGVDPRPLIVTVMFGASASFATPIGYQTNTLVYGAGDYRFSDFLKIGVPMNLIVGSIAVVCINQVFPLNMQV